MYVFSKVMVIYSRYLQIDESVSIIIWELQSCVPWLFSVSSSSEINVNCILKKKHTLSKYSKSDEFLTGFSQRIIVNNLYLMQIMECTKIFTFIPKDLLTFYVVSTRRTW